MIKGDLAREFDLVMAEWSFRPWLDGKVRPVSAEEDAVALDSLPVPVA